MIAFHTAENLGERLSEARNVYSIDVKAWSIAAVVVGVIHF